MNIHTVIALFHVFIVGPLLVYIGRSFGNLPEWAFPAMITTGIFVFFHHLMKTYQYGLSVGWIYALHAFLFAPLLVYLGYFKGKAHVAGYAILTMIGFAAIGYHGYPLIKKMFVKSDQKGGKSEHDHHH